MTLRGMMIAAPRSGSGKTTLTLGLLRALRRRGFSVGGLKNGPDYIDPAFHSAAIGRESFNLDSWAMAPQLISALGAQASAQADLIVAEASMGLFDGVLGATGRTGASADVAAQLGLPVVLVLDASGQAQSVGAIAQGCAAFDSRLKIAGAVLNKISSPRHLALARDGLARAGMRCFGALPKQGAVVLPERHLGLVQAEEIATLDQKLEELADFVEAHVDCAALLQAAAPVAIEPQEFCAIKPPGQKIALARDAAFSFIYPHVLAGWRAQGAEISTFSPLADEAPPQDADCVWLPGGYPELHAEHLAACGRFMAGLRAFAQQKPVHGECGGYMVLGESLIDASGRAHKMAGLLSVQTSFAKRKMTLGYREALLLEDCALGQKGQKFRGHEFHYASIVTAGADPAFALAQDAYGAAPTPAGSRRGMTTGSFFHCVAEQPQ